MAVKPLWNSPPQFVDANGDPYSGAFLFFYAAGSSTKQDTYTDDTGNTACDNPITLNSSGYPAVSGTILAPWGTVGQTYKIGLAAPGSADPPASFLWTMDDVSPINDANVSLDQWVTGATPTYVSATSFTLVGDQTATYTVGRRVKTTNSGGTVYSTIISSAFTALTTITVSNDSGTLDAGLSAVSYGLLTSTNRSIPSLGQVVELTSVAGTNTITASALVSTAAVVQGQLFSFVAAGSNTTATTLNVNGSGAKNVRYRNVACIGGEIVATKRYIVQYDGTQYQIVGGDISMFIDNNTAIRDNSDTTKQIAFQASTITTATTRTFTAANNDSMLGTQRLTPTATTSGVNWDFTIPSYATNIVLTITGFSTNGTSIPIIQLGDAGGIEATGYLGTVDVPGTGSTLAANHNTGFYLAAAWASTAVAHGSLMLTLVDAATFTWAISGCLGRSDIATGAHFLGGSYSLSAALTTVRLTMVNGTDAGDAGKVSGCYW